MESSARFRGGIRTLTWIPAILALVLWVSGCAGVVAGPTGQPPTSLTISSLTSSGVTTTGATISWTTNVASSSQVNYGTTANYTQSSSLNSTLTTSHSVILSGLTPSTGYHFRADSKDASGGSANSPDFTFTTAAGNPPVVSITSPASGTTVSGTIEVTVTATSAIGIASVQFRVDGGNVGSPVTLNPYNFSWNTTTLAKGNHTLTAVATDTSGNTTTSAGVTVTVNNTVAPPTVSITSPASGATVSGTVVVSATASSSVGIASVQFRVDGGNVGSPVTVAPYSFSLNTATLAKGNHTLTAIATDTAGNTTTSAGVTVNVNNTVAPPTVLITSPASGSTVSGTIAVSATASSSVGIASVQFRVDGGNVGAADTVAPYTLSLNTATLTNGSHTLTAVATDTVGNATTSAGVTVTVSNTVAPPTVSITSPASGATVSGTIVVSATASSSVGIAKVQFRVDGANVGTAVTVAPYTLSLNTATLTNGSHTLTAVATDTAGNATKSAGVTVTVNNTIAAPTVTITSPVSGSTVSGSVTVTATASSGVGIASVQFILDGTNLGSAAVTAPYGVTWDTTTSSNGSHSLTAVAKDTAGNTGTSQAVTVTISNGSGTVVNVTPSEDWCGAINNAAPGTTIVMGAGNYTTACSISSSGTSSSPIVIRAASTAPADTAMLTYQGSASNVLDVYGAYLQIQWLTFSGMQSGVDAIRFHSGIHNVTAMGNTFLDLGGTAVVYNDSGTADKISVIGNTVKNSSYTPFYLGCQDGATCHATNVLVDSNFVDTVNPTDGSVGYAVEVKLNSYGTVQNNTFYNTLGPCITVYGSNEGDPPTLVQGNYVQGSHTDAGINISGGPAIVWNNVSVGNANGGIWAQDYGGRGLQKNVWISFNTVIGNSVAGIITENWTAGAGDIIAYNAIGTSAGTPTLQPTAPIGTITGNVTCTPATVCFDQPTTAPYDLWPLAGGPLVGAGGNPTNPWEPTYDFMGAPRGTAADVGAFQRSGSGNGPAVGGGAPRPPFN